MTLSQFRLVSHCTYANIEKIYERNPRAIGKNLWSCTSQPNLTDKIINIGECGISWTGY